MGNVCGCVRAEKEEQCLDPAKAPLSPAKHSPGRKYFRRKTRKKSTEEGPDSAQVKENEEKSQYEVGISENAENCPKSVGLADSFPRRVTVAGNALPVSTDLSADLVKAKVLPGETKSDSLCGDTFHGDNQRLTKSGETGTWLKEQDKRSSEKCCTSKKKYSEDSNRRELAFLKKSSGLCYGKAASLDSAIHVLGRQQEETGVNITSCRIVEDVPESNKSEKLHHFLSESKSDLLLEQKRFYSSDAVLSQLPKEKVLFSIPPNKGKVNILAQYIIFQSSLRISIVTVFLLLQKYLHFAVYKPFFFFTHAMILEVVVGRNILLHLFHTSIHLECWCILVLFCCLWFDLFPNLGKKIFMLKWF